MFVILHIFRKTGAYKLDETFTDSLSSKTFKVHEVHVLVFSGTTLSTSRLISPPSQNCNCTSFGKVSVASGRYLLLPNIWLMGMCRWMGSHFHDWIHCKYI